MKFYYKISTRIARHWANARHYPLSTTAPYNVENSSKYTVSRIMFLRLNRYGRLPTLERFKRISGLRDDQSAYAGNGDLKIPRLQNTQSRDK